LTAYFVSCGTIRNRAAYNTFEGKQTEFNMAKNDDGYDQARELTEKAMDAYVKRADAQGDRLVDKAKSANERAVRDVNDELEEDAGSEHDPAKLEQEDSQKQK
jgi:hypothetical protein